SRDLPRLPRSRVKGLMPRSGDLSRFSRFSRSLVRALVPHPGVVLLYSWPVAGSPLPPPKRERGNEINEINEKSPSLASEPHFRRPADAPSRRAPLEPGQPVLEQHTQGLADASARPVPPEGVEDFVARQPFRPGPAQESHDFVGGLVAGGVAPD